MRLFFALLPDSNTRNSLSMAAASLRVSGSARLLTPENYHVTLAFIGEAPESAVQMYRRMGTSLSVPQCVIELDACEYWSSSQAVVLAARTRPHALVQPTDQLRAAVAPSRGPEKSWRAHATLARKVAQAPVLPAMSVSWVSHSFALMRSATGGGRAVYTVVDSWSLLDKT
jgi:RNA 2',3'-cyclic 3'-phosphodiesterase